MAPNPSTSKVSTLKPATPSSSTHKESTPASLTNKASTTRSKKTQATKIKIEVQEEDDLQADLPEVEAPQFQAPEFQTPLVPRAPISTAQVQTPEVQTPNAPISSPQVSTSQTPTPRGSAAQGYRSKKYKPIEARLYLGPPTPGTNLAKVIASPVKRAVNFRSTGKQAEADQKMLDGGRPDYQLAAQITARGELGTPCINCQINRGKFELCAVISDVIGGACGNCAFGGEHGYCSYVNGGKIPHKGMIRYNLTQVDVERQLAARQNKDYVPSTPTVQASKRRQPESTEQEDVNRGSEFSGGGVRSSKRLKKVAESKKN